MKKMLQVFQEEMLHKMGVFFYTHPPIPPPVSYIL